MSQIDMRTRGPPAKFRFTSRECLRAVYTFTDIGRLSINQNPSEKVPGAGAVRMPVQLKELVNFELTLGLHHRLVIRLSHQDQPDSGEIEKADSADSGLGGVVQTDDSSADISFGRMTPSNSIASACLYEKEALLTTRSRITAKDGCTATALCRQQCEDGRCATLVGNPPVLKFLKWRIWEGSVYV